MRLVNFRAYTTKYKARKWKHVVWSYILDTTRVNSQSIIMQTNPDVYGKYVTRKGDTRFRVSSFDFGIELATSLILPWIHVRPIKGLQSHILMAAFYLSGDQRYTQERNYASVSSEFANNLGDNTHSRKIPCRDCQVESHGPGYSKKKVRLSNIGSLCQKCGRHICRDKHMVQLCKSQCLKKLIE